MMLYIIPVTVYKPSLLVCSQLHLKQTVLNQTVLNQTVLNQTVLNLKNSPELKKNSPELKKDSTPIFFSSEHQHE
jgi:hypothetical protein